MICASHSAAAPYMNVSLLGRVEGSSDPYSSTVSVTPGAIIDYQVILNMSPVGTTNTTVQRTITSLTPGFDGVNCFKFDIFQPAAEATQVNFSSRAVLNPDPSPM